MIIRFALEMFDHNDPCPCAFLDHAKRYIDNGLHFYTCVDYYSDEQIVAFSDREEVEEVYTQVSEWLNDNYKKLKKIKCDIGVFDINEEYEQKIFESGIERNWRFIQSDKLKIDENNTNNILHFEYFGKE